MYLRSLTWVYCICHSSVLHVLSCKSGASLGVLHMPTGVLLMPSCTSGASLGCTALAIKCTAEAIMYFRSLTWVYCICHQVYCISYHAHQEPRLGVLHLPAGAPRFPASVLQRPSCTYILPYRPSF